MATPYQLVAKIAMVLFALVAIGNLLIAGLADTVVWMQITCAGSKVSLGLIKIGYVDAANSVSGTYSTVLGANNATVCTQIGTNVTNLVIASIIISAIGSLIMLLLAICRPVPKNSDKFNTPFNRAVRASGPVIMLLAMVLTGAAVGAYINSDCVKKFAINGCTSGIRDGVNVMFAALAFQLLTVLTFVGIGFMD